MPDVCIYFQVHQPYRLKQYSFFDIGGNHFYEDDEMNQRVLDKVSEKCYLPANRLLLNLIANNKIPFKCSFSLSGVFIEQLEKYRPDVLDSFKALAQTGAVEFLGETYYHSLSSVYSTDEFTRQVKLHKSLIKKHFGQQPKVFRNTELIYEDRLIDLIKPLGFKSVLAEGVDWYLNGKTPNSVYATPGHGDFPVMLKNYKLSDDVAFRFSDHNWPEYPLTAEKYAQWISEASGEVVNLFMDYETLGEHNWEDTGIFNFWKQLPASLKDKKIRTIKCSESVKKNKPTDIYTVHRPTSWADSERDLSAWKGNVMQSEALDKLYALEDVVLRSKDKDLIDVWRKLQTSDHFYYMSTKHSGDGAVHSYFSPYDSPYDAYIFFMNILSDFEITLERMGMAVPA